MFLHADSNCFIGALAARAIFFYLKEHGNLFVKANDFHNSAQYFMTNTHSQLTHLFFCAFPKKKLRAGTRYRYLYSVLSSPTSKFGNRGPIQLNKFTLSFPLLSCIQYLYFLCMYSSTIGHVQCAYVTLSHLMYLKTRF